MKKKFSFKEFKSFLLFILAALLIRAVLLEPYKIPSSSMVPSLMIGDHIFVNKMAYGLRVPFTNIYLTEFGNPKRGEVVVFKNPVPDDGRSFIKRVVGLPGDVIHYDGFRLTVNGETFHVEPIHVSQQPADPNHLELSAESQLQQIPVFDEWEHFDFYYETIGEFSHLIQDHRVYEGDPIEFTVPEGHYFMMGDNRDLSFDSRGWGSVPRGYLRGSATVIWLSWDSYRNRVRFERFGEKIR